MPGNLHQRGQVIEPDDPLRRVFLTGAGQHRTALLEREVNAHEAAMMCRFSKAERDRLLGRLDDNLRAALVGRERREAP
ncbi:MAG: hypothetical protein ACK5MY_06390 [Jhaorihella sp.]